MTELIDNPPPLPDHKHSLNSGNFAPLYTADQYRAGEAAAFARGVAAGRNAGLEEQANYFDIEARRTTEPSIRAMLLGFAAALRKDKR